MAAIWWTLSSHKWNLSQICVVFVDILTIVRSQGTAMALQTLLRWHAFSFFSPAMSNYTYTMLVFMNELSDNLTDFFCLFMNKSSLDIPIYFGHLLNSTHISNHHHHGSKIKFPIHQHLMDGTHFILLLQEITW